MEPADLDTETYETIPWSQLAPARTPLLTRVAAGVVGLGAAAALTFVLVTVMRSDPAAVVVTIPTAHDGPVPTTAAARPPVVTQPPSATPEPPALQDAGLRFTEADLMAVIPEEEQRLAVTYAQWFVTDFFTVDGDADAARRVRAMLPTGLDVQLPHDAPSGVSYVEWADAWAVRPDGPVGYTVDVAFRSLAGPGDGTLVRQPVRAVRVRIHVVEAGAVAIDDLPEPIAVPTAVSVFVDPPATEPSPEMGTAAVEAASAFGPAGELVGAGLDAAGWRLLVMVRDPSGMDFPFVIRP